MTKQLDFLGCLFWMIDTYSKGVQKCIAISRRNVVALRRWCLLTEKQGSLAGKFPSEMVYIYIIIIYIHIYYVNVYICVVLIILYYCYTIIITIINIYIYIIINININIDIDINIDMNLNVNLNIPWLRWLRWSWWVWILQANGVDQCRELANECESLLWCLS